MPIYGFECKQCHTQFEVRATFQEKTNGLSVKCPNCQSMDVIQQLSTGMFLRSEGRMNSSLPPSYCGPNSGSGCCGG